MKKSPELESILNLIHVSEKCLLNSVSSQNPKADDVLRITQYFIQTYFAEDHLLFYGDKFVDYDQLKDPSYLSNICETDIFVDLKTRE
jgi:hypothetical protein